MLLQHVLQGSLFLKVECIALETMICSTREHAFGLAKKDLR